MSEHDHVHRAAPCQFPSLPANGVAVADDNCHRPGSLLMVVTDVHDQDPDDTHLHTYSLLYCSSHAMEVFSIVVHQICSHGASVSMHPVTSAAEDCEPEFAALLHADRTLDGDELEIYTFGETIDQPEERPDHA